MSRCDGRRYSLRYKIFSLARRAVVEWSMVYRGKVRRKVAMTRRVRRGPFQCVRMSRVPFRCRFAGENADNEIHQEDQLSRTQNECRNRNKDVHRLLRLKEHVLRRVINTTHLAADAD